MNIKLDEATINLMKTATHAIDNFFGVEYRIIGIEWEDEYIRILPLVDNAVEEILLFENIEDDIEFIKRDINSKMYNIEVQRLFKYDVVMEANSPEEAKEKVNQLIINNELDWDSLYMNKEVVSLDNWIVDQM